jgi:hypothetical protein
MNLFHQLIDKLNYRQTWNDGQLYSKIPKEIHMKISTINYLSVIASIKTGRISFKVNFRAAFVAL